MATSPRGFHDTLGDANTLRISQRRPLACIECTRRKVKCDRTIPCSRCTRLGHSCRREATRMSKVLSKYRSEIQFLRKLRAQLVLESGPSTNPSVRLLERRIMCLEQGWDGDEAATAGADGSAGTSQDALPPQDSLEVQGNSGFAMSYSQSLEEIQPSEMAISSLEPARCTYETNDDTQGETAKIIMILENLGWGRHYGSCYPHTSCTCRTQRSKSEMLSISSKMPTLDNELAAPHLKDPNALPPASLASRLVEFHINHVTWHHNALHSPTFSNQCERFWQTGTCPQPLWMALYLSVLSTSVWCAQNSAKFRAFLNLDYVDDMAENLFRGMVDVLYSENFLENVSMYSIQAILISTEVAHNLGLSTFNANLTSAAARIAQCLGLHKIEDVPPSVIEPSDRWHERVEREIGKRTWCLLLIQDHFAIPFTDSSCIQPSQYSTSMPSNCDDDDLEEKDVNIPTISSYTRTLVQVASLIPLLVDSLGPLRERKSPQEQYQSVIAIDQQMRRLVGQIPGFLLREVETDQGGFPWLGTAQRSLAITAADKIIMIHRPFLFQSFQSHTYVYTRRTCVAAAKTILREHEKITAADDVSIWTHSAFCVTAIIVLGLEILYQQENDDEGITATREMILSARERLGNRRGDVMAERGVHLINAILYTDQTNQERDPPSALNQPVDFQHVVAEFLALDKSASAGADTVSRIASEQDDLMFLIDDDFDYWFSQTFVALNQT